MKLSEMKKAVALAVCACSLAGSAATAQVVIGSSSSSSSEYTVGSWSELGSNGFVVDRFGVSDGRLVAYGRLVPNGSVSVESFDASRLGSWTGIGSGYGESGVESRSNMTSDYDGPTSMSLVRLSDDDAGLDVSMGATSGNDRTSIDARMGATSANDRTSIDAKMGATSGNDRTGIDLHFGPTSGNDRVASGGIDLHFGPTSANDRTALDGDMGATSGNDRTSIDAKMGATSANDRTGIDLSVGATSGNDRTAEQLSLSSSSTIAVPVTVVSASCDAVRLSFGGSRGVTMTPSSSADADVRSSLCAVSSSSSNEVIATHLNDLID